MYTRCLTAKLRTDAAKQIPALMKNDVLPLLHKQRGFRDEVVMVAPERAEFVSLSFWETKEDAEAYGRDAYPEVLKLIMKVVEGTPKIQAYEVSDCTFHKSVATTA